jgi:hypothetical protein
MNFAGGTRLLASSGWHRDRVHPGALPEDETEARRQIEAFLGPDWTPIDERFEMETHNSAA